MVITFPDGSTQVISVSAFEILSKIICETDIEQDDNLIISSEMIILTNSKGDIIFKESYQ